jgi:hypothetical protein
MKAAVIAARLSGKVMGSMIATSIAPNTRPQIAPRAILDMFAPAPCIGLFAQESTQVGPQSTIFAYMPITLIHLQG